jgi:C4-dicarboxylate-binding protein DctP
MKLRNVLFAVVAVTFASSWALTTCDAAFAEETTLTFATTTPPKSNLEIASEKLVETVAEKTNGRIGIKHYGAGSLYNAVTIMPAISKRQIDLGILHVALVGRRSPVLEFIGSFGAQGCWDTYDHYFRFLDHPTVRKIASEEFSTYFNSRLLAPLAFGTGMVGRKDAPIKKVEDYKGLKMRTSGTAQATMYKALGAIPVGLSSKEIYTALQRGTIQGATSGLSRWRRSKLYEVAPYLTVDPTTPYLSMWLVVNNDAWNELSPDDQAILEGAARDLEGWTRTYAAKEREEDLAFIEEHAEALVEMDPEEVQRLISTVKPTMKELAEKQLGDRFEVLWGLLEKTR